MKVSDNYTTSTGAASASVAASSLAVYNLYVWSHARTNGYNYISLTVSESSSGTFSITRRGNILWISCNLTFPSGTFSSSASTELTITDTGIDSTLISTSTLYICGTFISTYKTLGNALVLLQPSVSSGTYSAFRVYAPTSTSIETSSTQLLFSATIPSYYVTTSS